MKKRKIIVGSRDSKLAILQTQMVMKEIQKYNPDIELELVTMKTTGDIILDKTLDKIGGKGLFVKELDDALKNRDVDITIHSLKDMPMEVDENLPLLAFFKRGNPFDALVLPKGVDIEKIDLKEYLESSHLPVGTSSLRRRIQIAKQFDVETKSVRGNVITRLEKLDNGEFSALILACSGLERLGLEDRISMTLDEENMIPATCQGTLVVQGRSNEDYGFLENVDDLKTRIESNIERSFTRALNGGCSAPISSFCKVDIDKNQFSLLGFYGREDMSFSIKDNIRANIEEAETLSVKLALKMREELLNG